MIKLYKDNLLKGYGKIYILVDNIIFMAKKSDAKVEVNKSHSEKLLVVTISLLSALLILNVVTLTGFSTKFTTDYGAYYGESACSRVGGIIFREGVTANHNGNSVMLEATSDDAVAVEVNGESRSILSGHEVWINGVIVKNFVSNDDDACLVLS